MAEPVSPPDAEDALQERQPEQGRRAEQERHAAQTALRRAPNQNDALVDARGRLNKPACQNLVRPLVRNELLELLAKANILSTSI
eukprot:489460-Heterocapsa_arctica.AAC.1